MFDIFCCKEWLLLFLVLNFGYILYYEQKMEN